MNLYASTMKGILAANSARRQRLIQQMTAAALRKQCGPSARRTAHESCVKSGGEDLPELRQGNS